MDKQLKPKAKLNILYIEDNLPDAEYLMTQFEGNEAHSITFKHCSTLAEGVAAGAISEFDLILLDLSLPDASGTEGVTELMKHFPTVPIVVLTGNSDERSAQQALKLGAQDHLVKGQFTDGAFMRVLERAFERGVFRKKLKDSEDALIRSTLEAQAASMAKSQFLASMSHEIRTPLNTIIGIADLLAETSLTAEQKKYVDVFQKAGAHLLELINNVLDLSKIEAGELQLDMESFDLGQVVETIADWAELSSQLKKLDFSVSMSPDVRLQVYGDPRRIRQVLINLIGNSIKFTKVGHVSLRVEVKGSTPEQQEILFTVSDTGIGISEKHQKTLFEPFTQGDQSITRRFGGTGLGLSISKKLVEKMGGTITFTSKVNHGTQFRVLLPFKTISQESIRSKANDLKLCGKKVLLVDDQLLYRAALKELLVGFDMSVTELESQGPVTVEKFQKLGVQYDFYFVNYTQWERIPSVVEKKYREIMNRTIFLIPSDHTLEDLDRVSEFQALNQVIRPIQWNSVLSAMRRVLSGKESSTQIQPVQLNQVKFVQTSLSLLIVEDMEDNRFLFGNYLKGTNYQVDFAENGLIGYQKFTENQYDLVFMDLQMPEMDGHTAMRKIREWERNNGKPKTPIIALTAHALAEEAKRINYSEFSGYLTKPIKKSEFLSFVARYSN